MRRSGTASGIWWLHPAGMFACICVAIALPAYLLPDRFYEQYWRTAKHFDSPALFWTLACAVVFAAGAAMGSLLTSGKASGPVADWRERIPWRSTLLLFNAAFYLCVFGYTVWAGAAVRRGANLAALKEVLSGAQGAIFMFH